jgi:transposase-like protein
VSDRFLKEQESRGKIGGIGITVQLDESKFGKRKYNKGRRTEGHWVLGMIADGSEDLRLVLCPNNKRTATELLPIIEKYIEPGTTIRTDFWRAYDGLDAMGYQHEKVNHSDKLNPFISPDGVHTNRIEASWRPAKDYFRTVKLRSVCLDCQEKMNEASDLARVLARTINAEQELCAECDGIEKACGEHQKQLKEVTKELRKEIRAIYDARSDCEPCQEYADKFADKLVEYCWRRQMKKEGRNGFMEVIEAIKESY